jgi:hypothetical protein
MFIKNSRKSPKTLCPFGNYILTFSTEMGFILDISFLFKMLLFRIGEYEPFAKLATFVPGVCG